MLFAFPAERGTSADLLGLESLTDFDFEVSGASGWAHSLRHRTSAGKLEHVGGTLSESPKPSEPPRVQDFYAGPSTPCSGLARRSRNSSGFPSGDALSIPAKRRKYPTCR